MIRFKHICVRVADYLEHSRETSIVVMGGAQVQDICIDFGFYIPNITLLSQTMFVGEGRGVSIV